MEIGLTQVEMTANEMAGEFGINQKSFQRALRNEENLSWPVRYERWTVRRGSEEYKDMKRVLDRLRSKLPKSSK